MSDKLIKDDSPLNRLPTQLHRSQRAWLEGVRFSIEIVDLTMRRLSDSLQMLTESTRGGMPQAVAADAYAAAITDAWTVLDAAWRLKRFIIDGRVPRGDSKTIPLPVGAEQEVSISTKEFRESLVNVKKLRDGYQHLDNNVEEMTSAAGGVAGYLNWLAYDPRQPEKARSCGLIQISVMDSSSKFFPLTNPMGKTFHSGIDHVTLNAFSAAVDLSHLHRQVGEIVRRFDTVLRPQFDGQPTSAIAAVASVEFSPGAPSDAEDLVKRLPTRNDLEKQASTGEKEGGPEERPSARPLSTPEES